MPDQKSKLEAICAERGLKMTDQRRVIARVLSESHDHPDVEALHKRAVSVDPNISIADDQGGGKPDFEKDQCTDRREREGFGKACRGAGQKAGGNDHSPGGQGFKWQPGRRLPDESPG